MSVTVMSALPDGVEKKTSSSVRRAVFGRTGCPRLTPTRRKKRRSFPAGIGRSEPPSDQGSLELRSGGSSVFLDAASKPVGTHGGVLSV